MKATILPILILLQSVLIGHAQYVIVDIVKETDPSNPITINLLADNGNVVYGYGTEERDLFRWAKGESEQIQVAGPSSDGAFTPLAINGGADLAGYTYTYDEGGTHRAEMVPARRLNGSEGVHTVSMSSIDFPAGSFTKGGTRRSGYLSDINDDDTTVGMIFIRNDETGDYGTLGMMWRKGAPVKLLASHMHYVVEHGSDPNKTYEYKETTSDTFTPYAISTDETIFGVKRTYQGDSWLGKWQIWQIGKSPQEIDIPYLSEFNTLSDFQTLPYHFTRLNFLGIKDHVWYPDGTYKEASLKGVTIDLNDYMEGIGVGDTLFRNYHAYSLTEVLKKNTTTPEGKAVWGDFNYISINESSSILAIATKDDNNDGVIFRGTYPDYNGGDKLHLVLIMPIEFITSDITKGFDYPIPGDPPSLSDDPTAGFDKDIDSPSWRTTINSGESDELSVNHHVKLSFPTDELSQGYTIRVRQGDPLTVTPEKPTGKETQLTITGANSADLKVARVEVVDKTTHEVVRKLDVLEMPTIKIPVRIVYLEDPTYPGPGVDGTNITRVGNAWKVNDQIIEHLNKAFGQCCVQFELASNSGDVELAYDSAGPSPLRNGALDSGTLQDSEMATILNSGYFDQSTITIFVVHSIISSGSDYLGFVPSDNGRVSRWAFVQTEHALSPDENGINLYLNVIAHEVGHILALSARNFPIRLHDSGPGPTRYGVVPLMAQFKERTDVIPNFGGKPLDIWIRSEDWEVAHAKAQEIKQSP